MIKERETPTDPVAIRERSHDEAIAILDSLHDRFLFDKSSDHRIEAIDRADARLRELLKLLAATPE